MTNAKIVSPKLLLYSLSLTWGLPLTLAGFLTAIILLATGHRPNRHAGCWCFTVGNSNWGGLNLGLVILCQPTHPISLKNHELGHAIQNCYLGPIMVFFVLYSAIRYHCINYMGSKGKLTPLYDAWWFEGQATRLGEKYFNRWITNN